MSATLVVRGPGRRAFRLGLLRWAGLLSRAPAKDLAGLYSLRTQPGAAVLRGYPDRLLYLAQAGHEVVGHYVVPAHLLGQGIAVGDALLHLLVGSGQRVHQDRGEALGLDGLDAVALADRQLQQFVGRLTGPVFRQVQEVGFDDVLVPLWRAVHCLAGVAHAAANVGHHADRAEAECFELADAVWLVHAQAELQVGASPDIGEGHVRGHALAAVLWAPVPLVDQHRADGPVIAIEIVERLAESLLAAAEVGIALLVRDGPAVNAFHVLHVLRAALAAERAEHVVDGGLAALGQQGFHLVEHAQVAPDRLG